MVRVKEGFYDLIMVRKITMSSWSWGLPYHMSGLSSYCVTLLW